MSAAKIVQSGVTNLIRSRIMLSGPIPVADYMKLALTARSDTTLYKSEPAHQGYYMKKDVFGREGDFITSPEISQLFGEMIAVWGLQTWMQIGGPKKFSIVELGPGRGTLAKDVLRVFKQFEKITGNDVSLHLVEISPYLASLQCAILTQAKATKNGASDQGSASQEIGKCLDPFKEIGGESFYHHEIAAETGFPVYWYRNIKDLPRDFHLYIAHEFFDALPVHKLQKVGTEWHEVLVDVDPKDESTFRFVVSRNETPAIKLLQQSYPSLLQDQRQHIEISIDALVMLDNLANRLNTCGGIAKIIDYGHDGTKEDTFRAFYKHNLHNPLVEPGKADLTCDVDFSLLRKALATRVIMLGPVSQQDFLNRVGIQHRLQTLLEKCPSSQENINLTSGYKMIMDDMGSRFHAITLLPKILEKCMTDLKLAGYST